MVGIGVISEVGPPVAAITEKHYASTPTSITVTVNAGPDRTADPIEGAKHDE